MVLADRVLRFLMFLVRSASGAPLALLVELASLSLSALIVRLVSLRLLDNTV